MSFMFKGVCVPRQLEDAHTRSAQLRSGIHRQVEGNHGRQVFTLVFDTLVDHQVAEMARQVEKAVDCDCSPEHTPDPEPQRKDVQANSKLLLNANRRS